MKVCNFLSLLLVILLSSGDGLPRSKYNNKVVTCYVASWAVYRASNGKFTIDNVRPELCTHLVYAFAGLDNETWAIRSLDPGMDIENGIGNYKKMTQLREKNPELNVLLAIGGWNEGSESYSALAANATRRSTFIRSVVNFLRKYGFNGFDIDWEYPGSRGGDSMDRENFVHLVKELKEAFREYNYLLTAAISSNKDTIDKAYDIPELSKYLDHIHVMAYDYHGTWSNKVLPNAPLKSDDGQSVMDTLKYLLSKDAPANKLVLGLPMYGRTFILKTALNSSDASPINQPTTQSGFKGPYTGQDGFMGYNEICEKLVTDKNWRTGWDDKSETPYAVKNDHVIVFDNPRSLTAKVEYAMSLNLSGVMIWSIDTDDFNGKCASLNNSIQPTEKTFPLMRSINTALGNSIDNNDHDHHSNDNNNNNNDDKSTAAKFTHNSVLLILAFLVYYI
ncbi:putative chitinase 2 [Xylocopa sonorina]|uniref:putative chitinase 2 n=1 Tax=Xylocopa sonorina TaxID=1818115 RepID=UPI00403A8820